MGHTSRVCLGQEQQQARGQHVASRSLANQKPGNFSHDTKIRLSSISPTSKRKTLVLEVTLNGIQRFCVVDTGASVSLISKTEWELVTKETQSPLSPSDIIAEAANNSPIGVVGKTLLSVDVDGQQRGPQTFYVANDISNEIILGLDWLTNCQCVINTSKLLIEFPDGAKAPLLLNDSSIPDPTAVILCDDTEIPPKHEVIRRAKVKGVFLTDSIIEPNVALAEKGILVARAFVLPNRQTVPVQIIREFKHGYENNNEYDRSYWCYFRSRTGKFDLSFHVVRACQIYANHDSVQCEYLAFSSLECYNPQNLINYYDMAGNNVNAEENLPTERRI